jgi:hypothetical protein
MNLANVNHDTLSTQLSKPVSEVMVVVAKHRVAGVSCESIAEMIGCDPHEIEALESEPLYAEVRGIIGALATASTADQPFIWDSIETIAGRRLMDRIERENDPEFLLRAAATANRMIRRNGSTLGQPLEPSAAGRSVAVKLTRRMVEKFTQDGTRMVATEEQLSIHDGSMVNPQFSEVNDLLGLRPGVIQAPGHADVVRNLGLEEMDV